MKCTYLVEESTKSSHHFLAAFTNFHNLSAKLIKFSYFTNAEILHILTHVSLLIVSPYVFVLPVSTFASQLTLLGHGAAALPMPALQEHPHIWLRAL